MVEQSGMASLDTPVIGTEEYGGMAPLALLDTPGMVQSAGRPESLWHR